MQPAAGLNAHGRADDQGSVLLPELGGRPQERLGRGCAHGLEAGAHQQDHPGQIGQAQAAPQQGAMGEQGAVAQGAAVRPPQQLQDPPAAGGIGAGVQIRGEQEPADQKAQAATDGPPGAQPGPPEQGKREAQDPGGAVVMAAASHSPWQGPARQGIQLAAGAGPCHPRGASGG